MTSTDNGIVRSLTEWSLFSCHCNFPLQRKKCCSAQNSFFSFLLFLLVVMPCHVTASTTEYLIEHRSNKRSQDGNFIRRLNAWKWFTDLATLLAIASTTRSDMQQNCALKLSRWDRKLKMIRTWILFISVKWFCGDFCTLFGLWERSKMME